MEIEEAIILNWRVSGFFSSIETIGTTLKQCLVQNKDALLICSKKEMSDKGFTKER